MLYDWEQVEAHWHVLFFHVPTVDLHFVHVLKYRKRHHPAQSECDSLHCILKVTIRPSYWHLNPVLKYILSE